MQPKTITKTTWIAFSAALAAAMMDLLDATIASVAGPVMQADLGGSYADLQWITAAYTLAMAVGLLTGGRLGDMFGRKRMLLIGAGGFTIASVLCAAAPSAELLIGSRALQGAARRGHAAAGLRPDPRPLPGRPDGQGVGRAGPGVRPVRRARPDRGRPADRRRHRSAPAGARSSSSTCRSARS